jgi:Zn-dependent M28 family amino/carboxypeptidase
MRKISVLLLPLFFLGSCFTNDNITLNNEVQISASQKILAENLVDKSRIEKNLAILSGKSPVSENNIIPERGTVEGRLKTRNYLISKLESIGYKTEKHNYRKNGENIFVRLMADVPTDEYILAGAHMDSVKNSGANDNGTGSAAVLELAEVMKKVENRKVNIIFAWFDEEELGLIGSEAMASDFKRQGLKISSVHTIDMMGWDSDKDRTVEIERPDGFLWDYYKMVNQTHNINLPLKRTNSGSTDHVAFRSEGFVSVGLCEEWAGGDTTPHYHKKSDTYETINFDFLASSTRLFAAVISDLSQKVAPPRNIEIIPHEKFPGRDRHFHSSYDSF